jgi:hypothetical protein
LSKETDALLKIARERENKKDLLAYQKLKEISAGRTYSEVQDILDRMGKQLSRWVGATPCQPNEHALDWQGHKVTPPVDETTGGRG